MATRHLNQSGEAAKSFRPKSPAPTDADVAAYVGECVGSLRVLIGKRTTLAFLEYLLAMAELEATQVER